MNFSLLQERVRAEIKRRIDRGLLTGVMLAERTGLRPSHISNFLRQKRNLSIAALDRVLAALSLSVFDLAPLNSVDRPRGAPATGREGHVSIPLVTHAAAIHSPLITRSAALQIIRLPASGLELPRSRGSSLRNDWHRFVAIRLTTIDALPMSPVLHSESIVVLDRHYRSLVSCRPPWPNIYAVNSTGSLVFRYVSQSSGQIILRPHAIEHPVELLEIAEIGSPLSCIVGRVCICISPL
jgi:transcriptional regulator with XRE-family HTH domain